MITKPSLCSNVVVSTLVLALSGFIHTGASFAQDISGGASVVLASADVEAKFGKGIFSTPKNVAHTPKPIEKKTVTLAAHTTRPQRTTTASNKPEARKVETRPRTGESSRPSGESSNPSGESTKPLGGPARRVLTAEEVNKQ